MKSKVFLLLILHALFILPVTAQDAMPTKEETVNYINKKMQEVLGFDVDSSSTSAKYTQLWFRRSGENVEVGLVDAGGSPPSSISSRYTYVFNPRHIKDVTIGKPGKGRSTAMIGINFQKGTLREGPSLRVNDLDAPFVNIPYLATLPGNAEKIAKAILHLRDLAKAEDDLF